MPMRSWCAAALALLPSIPCLAPPTAAQQAYRPDADGYPCKRARLDIVAAGGGFVIEPRSPAPATMVARPAKVSIGNSLNIDRVVLERGTAATEATHATRR